MVAALMRKLDRETAAYFSFLLSTPAICGAVLLQLKDVVTGEVEAAFRFLFIRRHPFICFIWLCSGKMDDQLFKASFIKNVCALRLDIRCSCAGLSVYGGVLR